MNLFNKEHFEEIGREWLSNRCWLMCLKRKDEGLFYQRCLPILMALNSDDPARYCEIMSPALLKHYRGLKKLLDDPRGKVLDNLMYEIRQTAWELMGVTARINYAFKKGTGDYGDHVSDLVAYAICHVIGLTQIPW